MYLNCLKNGIKQQNSHFSEMHFDILDMESCYFIIIFELYDLNIVDIGPNFIKIGQEMPILELFLIHVQKPLFLPTLGSLYLIENATFATFRKIDCGICSRSNLGPQDPKP